MSYNEEQSRSYDAMLYAFSEFENMKKVLSQEKCQVHNKKLKMGANWEREYDIDITIYKYCCMEFAKQIADKFIEADIFTSVSIEKQ